MNNYLIIGGSSGIGLQLVKQLSEEENLVVATYSENKPQKKTVRVEYHFLDVTDEDQNFDFHSQVAASKGAVEGLTRALAAELVPRIRVNCIAPSLTDTPLAEKLLNNSEKQKTNAARHPLKRIGKTSDQANMAQFLLSDKSDWITGQILHVDGGMSTLKI